MLAERISERTAHLRTEEQEEDQYPNLSPYQLINKTENKNGSGNKHSRLRVDNTELITPSTTLGGFA